VPLMRNHITVWGNAAWRFFAFGEGWAFVGFRAVSANTYAAIAGGPQQGDPTLGIETKWLELQLWELLDSYAQPAPKIFVPCCPPSCLRSKVIHQMTLEGIAVQDAAYLISRSLFQYGEWICIEGGRRSSEGRH
jgi:hypothetical protein